MTYNPNIHHRKSIRLKGYDYSQAGLYFITICIEDRLGLLGDVINGEMVLNDAGKMVEIIWLGLPERFASIVLHEYVVMPNHFHAILEIVGGGAVVSGEPVLGQPILGQPISGERLLGQPRGVARTEVGAVVGAFKSIATVEYIRGVKNLGWAPFNGKLWHRNYWEHIIRDEQSYGRIAAYIINNPKNWGRDKFKRR